MRFIPLSLLAVFLLLVTPLTGFAEEAAAPVAEATDPWVVLITSVLGIVLAWGGKLLREKWKISGKKVALDATKSLWEQRNFLIDNRIIPFALSTAEHWLATQIPVLVADAVDGGEFKWSSHWAGLRKYVKSRVIKKFAEENVDVVELLGVEELDDLLDRLLFKLIGELPEGVKKFIPEAIVDKTTDWATAFAVDKAKDLLAKV
ncbi:MAG: hypothetical protein F6K48_02985 [Okeania sp. SIO3H1]|nr:hypothetical protein [Okeania sp. SIO3H1]